MRIVSRNTFLAMPPGTLFSKYEPCCFDELMIKGDSLVNDFYYQDIACAIESTGSDELFSKLHRAQETGESLRMDFNCQGRDGCFDTDEIYAVWERADVEALISRLQETLRATTERMIR